MSIWTCGGTGPKIKFLFLKRGLPKKFQNYECNYFIISFVFYRITFFIFVVFNSNGRFVMLLTHLTGPDNNISLFLGTSFIHKRHNIVFILLRNVCHAYRHCPCDTPI
jgi:hypothetical protein